MRICCCAANVTHERHKTGRLPLNLHRPIFARGRTTVGMGSAVDSSARGELLGNARNTGAEDRLFHVAAVLNGRVEPALITKPYEQRVQCAAAATGGLADRLLQSTLVDRARQSGSHGTILRRSTAGTEEHGEGATIWFPSHPTATRAVRGVSVSFGAGAVPHTQDRVTN